ncbi:MAG TPA: hypothetical protein VNL95_08515 [Dehalococcoidia bacterium]|nr:hypothetical protein [Dehalococcoidia bacterium]
MRGHGLRSDLRCRPHCSTRGRRPPLPHLRRMALALAAMPLAVLLACGGRQASPPAADEVRLPGLAELLRRAFPDVALESVPGQGLSLAADPRWRISPLPPPLQGQPWGMLAFFSLEGPSGLAPGLELPSGTYAVSADASTYFVDLDASRLLPLTEMGQGLSARPASPGAVRPLLALDADGDGLDEIALAWQGAEGMPRYRVYWREGQGWTVRAGVHTPAQAALDYWSAVASALEKASVWTPVQRYRYVWPWLGAKEQGQEEDMDQVAQELAQEDGQPVEGVRQQLQAVHDAFRAAWEHLSPQFQQRQTWRGFINGFRFSEAVQVEAVQPPRRLDGDRSLLLMVVSLRQREGEEVVWRRFEVRFRAVQSHDGRWLLDDVDAQELP